MNNIKWEKLSITIEEALETCIRAYEDDSYYYILGKRKSHYDNGMYRVDKKTGQVYNYLFTVFLTDNDDAREVTAKEIKMRCS